MGSRQLTTEVVTLIENFQNLKKKHRMETECIVQSTSILLSNLHIKKKDLPSKAVKFVSKGDGETRHVKYLTAKYGPHQMALIRKRLRVEMWMLDQLQLMSKTKVEYEDANEVEIDLDEVLDIEDDDKRRLFIKELLKSSKSNTEMKDKFIEELLEKARTL